MSTRRLIPRNLAGFNRSRQTHASQNGLYDLLNLRPVRGQLHQTHLIAPFVDDFGEIITITSDATDWSDWTAYSVPSFGVPQALDMADWTGDSSPEQGEAQALDTARWTGFILPSFGDEQELDMDNWTDGGL